MSYKLLSYAIQIIVKLSSVCITTDGYSNSNTIYSKIFLGEYYYKHAPFNACDTIILLLPSLNVSPLYFFILFLKKSCQGN